MNYYEHHLGDYARDAGHLSIVEEGVYRRLLDAYYARESPLPLGLSQCKKLARVSRSPVEHRAVEYVLAEFFVKEADGYHQKRCDEEIQRFRSRSATARSSANARWSHSERNAKAMRTHCERINGNMQTHCEGNALQSPDSSLQSPITKKDTPPTPSRGGVGGNGFERQRRRREEPWTPPKTADEYEREEAARGAEESMPETIPDHTLGRRHAER